jgi:hypothetical protein
LIGGALVTKGINNTPHRMTNINLTHLSRKALHLSSSSRRLVTI